MGNKVAYGLRDHVLLRVMQCPWGDLTGQIVAGRAVHKKVDPADLPEDYIRQLFRNAPVVKDRIRWTNPPRVYIPRQ